MNEDSRSIVSVDVNKSRNGAAISDVIDKDYRIVQDLQDGISNILKNRVNPV